MKKVKGLIFALFLVTLGAGYVFAEGKCADSCGKKCCSKSAKKQECEREPVKKCCSKLDKKSNVSE